MESEHEPDDGSLIEGCIVCKRCCLILEGDTSGKTKASREPCRPTGISLR